jgi:hypothetical protein
MAMYLSGVPVFTIMLLGWWSSDAFLRYIRKQVQEFSSGVSSKMIQKEEFFTIPTDSTNTTKSSNHPIHNTQWNKNGLYFRDAIRPLIEVFQWRPNYINRSIHYILDIDSIINLYQ